MTFYRKEENWFVAYEKTASETMEHKVIFRNQNENKVIDFCYSNVKRNGFNAIWYFVSEAEIKILEEQKQTVFDFDNPPPDLPPFLSGEFTEAPF